MNRPAVWLTNLILALAGASPPHVDVVEMGGQAYVRHEWRASTFAPSRQAQPAVDVDTDGNLIVVWSSRRQQGGRSGIYAQRFGPDGVAIGGETCVNLWRSTHQRLPAICAAGSPAQGAWLVWESHAQDGDAGSIIARRFEASFQGGSEIAVNQSWRGHQSSPAVAVSPTGSALVVWSSQASNGALPQARGRAFDADGSPRGDEFAIADRPGRGEHMPAVAFMQDGRFAIVFATTDQNRRPTGVGVQPFDAAGAALGDEVEVADGGAIEPVIEAAEGGYIVSWLASDGDDYGVLARFLDAQAQPRGAAVQVNTAVRGPQTAPAVAVGPRGRVAIAYNSWDDEGPGIFVQLFDAESCARLGGEFRLNKQVGGVQRMRPAAATRRLVFTPDGSMIGVWSGDGGFGDATSVNVTLLSPRRLEPSGRERGVTAQMKPALAALALRDGPQPHEPPRFDPAHVDAPGAREVEQGVSGIGFTGIFNTGWRPPDPHLAVSPTHLVAVVNGAIAFFTKDGAITFQTALEGLSGFWGALGTTDFVFDPEVMYDPLSGRFFVIASEAFAPGARSFALVAVSDDSDPNGTWHKYRFETTAIAGELFDSLNIGVDQNVMYVTGDARGENVLLTFDKTSLLAGLPAAITRSATLPVGSKSAGLPPVSFDSSPVLYLIAHEDGVESTAVRLIAVGDPLGRPAFTTVMLPVPAYGPPEDPPQMGSSVRLDTFAARFWSVAYRSGSLWATHHINSDRVVVRWYEIVMNGWPSSGEMPQLRQSGEIDPGPDVRTFFSAITVDSFGNAAMTFARSSPTEFISMATAFRYASDPLGTFQPDVIRQSSANGYSLGRWGDYGGVSVDPADGITFWAHHEYTVGTSWRTWIASFTPEFEPADVNMDGTVNVLDLIELLLCFGQLAVGTCAAADVVEDGVIDVLDLLEWYSSMQADAAR